MPWEGYAKSMMLVSLLTKFSLVLEDQERSLHFKKQNQPSHSTMAKGMGNGFPIGGILIHPDIKASYGMLGTTFGGNHLACVASLAVLDILKMQSLEKANL